MSGLKGKTIVITGASRGIGRAIALKCAQDGANIVIASKTTDPHPTLPGTIYTVAEEVKAVGGQALPLKLDVRDSENVEQIMKQTAEAFGGIDILVNNAGAINLTDTESTPMKRYDLMQDVNVRAVFSCSQAALPYLKKAENPHILSLSPPVSLDPKWLQNHVAYTISKYGMTLCSIGMSAEFERYGIAVNSLWPRTIIATAAINWIMGDDGMKQSRTPAIMADTAYMLFNKQKREITGQAIIDEYFLRDHGIDDFDQYANDPDTEPMLDFFVEEA